MIAAIISNGFVALTKYAAKLDIVVSSINASPAHRKVYNDFINDPYWKPLKEADLVYAYATRRTSRCEPSGISWWTLPQFAKPFMKPEAKMIAQYDDEFVWLFNPLGSWWNLTQMPNPDNYGGPEQFFKKTEILEVPDGHIVVTNNPLFVKYTTKPVFKVPLPHLCRYKLEKYSENHKGNNIALMLHSAKSASLFETLDNVIRPKNYAVTIFNGTLNTEVVRSFRAKSNLPVNSNIYQRMEYDAYADLLWRENSIGLDNNTGYMGWSRFAMECAVTCIPCIGSSDSVYDLFPELYTAPQDYAKQIELIKRLRTDKKFYHEMVVVGRKRVTELLNDEKLCRTFLDCFDKVGASKTNITIRSSSSYQNPDYKPDKKHNYPHP